ncbi:MAG: hypothetical protein CL610_25795 [Anaerolineaceae bacterium]|nr:hypothetical protein [Anaerolineaceae bacterium]
MPAGDSTSLLARAQYRIIRQLKRMRQLIAPEPAPEITVPAQAFAVPDDPHNFTASDYGSGAYGHWILDDNNLPAYQYEMNQFEDDRAAYSVSEGAFRRDHWHQVGNERLNALASNDGTIQVFIADRGGLFLNYFNYGDRVSWLGAAWEVVTVIVLALPRALKGLFIPAQEPGPVARIQTAINAPGAHNRDDQQHAYAGGFGYVHDGQQVWSTAYRYSPALRSTMERVFGMGYFRTVTHNRDIETRRTVYAPPGNVSAVLVDVELRNTGSSPMDCSYYEYWDVNIQQLPFQVFRSGVFGSVGDSERRKINRQFTPCIVRDNAACALRFHLNPPDGSPALNTAHEINWKPPDIFLADLSGTPDAYYTDKNAFFGTGGAKQPDAIVHATPQEIRRIPDTIMPYCTVLRRDLHLNPGETVKLRFAYGIVSPDDDFDCARPYPQGDAPTTMPESWQLTFGDMYRLRTPGPNEPTFDAFEDMVQFWKKNLAYFSTGNMPHLQREMAWHTYYLLSSTVYHEYFGTRVVPQGSAYLYLHGLDGVPRDFSLYVLPLIYLNPGLARDMLCLVMTMTPADTGQIAYSYTGNGILSSALVHHTPSDLDLFFLLAVAEYLAATGDTAFLDEHVPFYPGFNQPQDCSVLNHIRVAFDHLLHDIGIGDSDLIRVSDGDWSDDVVLRNVFPFAPLTSPRLTIEHGESVLNSQMALYILPRIADLLAGLGNVPAARTLGEHMQAEIAPALPRLENGIRAHWNGAFYARAVLRYWWNGKRVLRPDKLDLEGQVWALIHEFEPEPGALDKLKDAIYDLCDGPSPIGALLAGGTVWPAVSQLLTWGYVRRYPDLAWRSFINHTFATKAEVYPDTWMNIWTGPDGINGPNKSEPGGTYHTPPVTPMTDFPAMNNNQHALALLAMLRVCGIEPSAAGDGLRIAPQMPDHYALDLPLLRLNVTPSRIDGEYRAHNAGTCRLTVRLSAQPTAVQVTINDQTEAMTPDADGLVRLDLPPFVIGDVITFMVQAV